MYAFNAHCIPEIIWTMLNGKNAELQNKLTGRCPNRETTQLVD